MPQLDAFFLPPLLEALGLNWGDRSAWHDSWLEDSPSSNGSGWAEKASAGNPPPGEPVEQGETTTGNLPPGGESVVESAEAEPSLAPHSPAIASPGAGRSGPSDYCDFHRCDRIVCLCWD